MCELLIYCMTIELCIEQKSEEYLEYLTMSDELYQYAVNNGFNSVKEYIDNIYIYDYSKQDIYVDENIDLETIDINSLDPDTF